MAADVAVIAVAIQKNKPAVLLIIKIVVLNNLIKNKKGRRFYVALFYFPKP